LLHVQVQGCLIFLFLIHVRFSHLSISYSFPLMFNPWNNL
jgi:hypothetical protein